MACNNLLIANNYLNRRKIIPTNVHFNNVSEKSSDPKWQHFSIQHRYSTFAEREKYNNAAALQINGPKNY